MTVAVLSEVESGTLGTADSEHGADYHPVLAVHDLLERTSASLAAAESPGPQARGSLLDAFLSAASLCQVVSDHLYRDVGDLKRIARYASRLPGPAGGSANAVLQAGAMIGHHAFAAREQRLFRWLATLEAFTGDLADALWASGGAARPDELATRWQAIVASGRGLPRGRVAVPPRCFFSFDQRPEDCVELAARFAAQEPDRGRPLVVVGVRTSGCFLAPIVAAALRGLGFSHVGWASWRPGQPASAKESSWMRMLSSSGGSALIVDDPPTSGGSIARTAEALVAAGLTRQQIWLLLPLFPGRRAWGRRLEGWSAIELDWRDWDIHRRLSDELVSRDLRDLLVGSDLHLRRAETAARRFQVAAIDDVRRIDGDMGGPEREAGLGRNHIQATYRARVRARDGSSQEYDVLVKGVGLGMFGRGTAAVARRLDGLTPVVHGIRDGLMYQESPSEELLVDETDPSRRESMARAVGRYAAQRAAALPVTAGEATLLLSGHDAVWEQTARWLGEGFGRLALPMRPLLHASARKLAAAQRPSLIDGSMGRGRWFQEKGALFKNDWDEGAYVYQLPFCYDAAYDVAAAASERLDDRAFGTLARDEFEVATGLPIGAVRWFLYRLISELDRQARVRRAVETGAAPVAAMADVVTEGERRAAALHRELLAGIYLGDLKAGHGGEAVAIDIDGVLESARWSYPTPSIASLLALRALAMHGFRTVIATGRSLDESVQRCHDYRLAGAVAEYGSVIHVAGEGSENLVGTEGMGDLDALRASLRRQTGVYVDPAYERSVRAFAIMRGRRTALPGDVAREAVTRLGLEKKVQVIEGWAQTDFVAQGVDKGSGLRALMSRLGVDSLPPLALAVGDSTPDLPMFSVARRAAAPANARAELGTASGVVRCRSAYGRGLAEATAMVVGHMPNQCRLCESPALPRGDLGLLLGLMRVSELQGLGKLHAIWRAALGGRPF